MCEKLFTFILGVQCFSFPNQRYESLDVIRILFYSENLTPIWGNESQSKIHINLHNLPTKTVNNSVIHVGTTIYFGRILEGFWPKKYRLCNPSCPRKVELTEYFKQLHYSIEYHLSGGRCNMTDSPPYNITCNQTSCGDCFYTQFRLILWSLSVYK